MIDRYPLFATLRHRARLASHLWRLERRDNKHWPNLALLSQGFLSNRAWLYPFDRFDPELFLTDLEVEARLPRLNEPDAQAVLGDKRQFHLWALNAAVETAELIGFVTDGMAQDPDGSPLAPDAVEGRAMIAKPVDGSGGRDVRRVSGVFGLPPGRWLLEAPVVQHPYAAAIFPDAVNTVRVIIGRYANGETMVIGAAHRFGTARSAPTDNFKAGGIVSLVDPETGALSGAIADLGGPRRAIFDHHPETGTPITGAVVPDWQAVLTLALRATLAMPGLAYVGWDIAVTERGPLVIEGNAGLANPNLVQFHEPLLVRRDVREFFASTGVLSSRRLKRLKERRREAASS